MRQNLDPHQAWRGRWPSMTTQFVVGGVGESDLELLETTVKLIKVYHMSRAYYSGFKPVKGTPLEECSPDGSMAGGPPLPGFLPAARLRL